MPMARIMPAMPGSVRVKLLNTGKKPDTAAMVPAIWPSRPMQATKPGRRYTLIMNTQMSTKAMMPAITMASRLWLPRLGLRVL